MPIDGNACTERVEWKITRPSSIMQRKIKVEDDDIRKDSEKSTDAFSNQKMSEKKLQNTSASTAKYVANLLNNKLLKDIPQSGETQVIQDKK